MKNLFAIPRLSLSGAFTILITLVVCLAGFTEAEISNYRKEDPNRQELNFFPKESSFKENDQNILESPNARSNKLKQNYFAYLKSLPEYSFDKLNKRHSDYFAESDESDDEKEIEGYNYDDDDECYHFNHKRNDENTGKIEDGKSEKEKLDEFNQKKYLGQRFYPKNFKENDKELKKIEMLNFKEIHPNIGSDMPQNPFQRQKPFANDMDRKKIPFPDSLTSLKIIDLKENSAIDENLRERKEESSGVLASSPSDSKIAEGKKAVKSTDEKDSVKLKDTKLGDDSEKKDKEASLKDGKEVVAAKNIKESSKTSEEKEKGVKLSDAAKLEENIEKMSSKNKESETAKLTKEEKDLSRFSDKVTSDAINPKEISQINNRASFVSNDYKDSFDTAKTPEGQIGEKNSEEINENGKNIGLRNYPKNFWQNSEKLKEKQSSLEKTENSDNYELLNGQYDIAKVVQEQEKSSPYFTVPVKQEFQYEKPKDTLYKKRESWKDAGSMSVKSPQQQPVGVQEPALRHHGLTTQDQQSQQPQVDMSYESQLKPNTFQMNMPTNELENTEYHKNYMKFLKKYKNQNENSKNINSEPQSSGYDTVRQNSFRGKAENKNKKRSGKRSDNERKSMQSEEMSQEKEKEKEKEPIQLSNLRISNYRRPDTSQSEKCVVPTHESQSLSTKTRTEDSNLSDIKKYEEQPDSNRLRRKSPVKFEYEIKVINQNQQDPKSARLSRFSPMRLKKDVKAKLATGDKYLKKYPYSQVSRDDLINLNKMTGSENEKKRKRKAPLWKRQSQKFIRTRAAPSGYYSNRVKFGQKSYARNNEKTNSDPNTPIEVNQMPSPYFNQAPSEIDKNIQQGWEAKQQSFRHDPMKRFDEDAYLNEANSLFLVRKGERTAKAFEEGSNKVSEELDPEQLAKILTKANEYVVLKKTDNKFRKISEQEPFLLGSSDFNDFSLYGKEPTTFEEQFSQNDNIEKNERPISLKSKSLEVRSSNLKKNDKKYSAAFRSSASKSNLKKTFEKFRDLADFFKDNEQESSDNQYSAQDAKEGRDIVFSEDKLPDPIVISSDGSEKNEGLKQKPQNSIYSISTNFKNLDQQGKKSDSSDTGDENKNTFMSGIKSEAAEFSWEPALKSAFPEAKSINAMNKNGNEIIVLDFNRNQLKTEHGFHLPQKMSSGSQSFGTFGSNSRLPSSNPMNFLGDRKIQLIVNENPLASKVSDNIKNEFTKNPFSNEQNKKYEIISNGEKQPVMSVPLFRVTELPNLLKTLLEKNPNKLTFNTKLITKKSKDKNEENEMSENYVHFPRNLDKLSKINKNVLEKENSAEPGKKRSVNKMILPSSSFSELSTYTDSSIRKLGNLLQNVISKDNPINMGYSTDNSDRIISKNAKEYLNLDDFYQKHAGYGAGFSLERPSQWFPTEENNKDREENVSKTLKDNLNNILQNQEMSKVKEKIYAQLREEIEKASDKVHRLRREGIEKRKLKKAIENAIPLKEVASPVKKSQEEDTEKNAKTMTLNSNDLSMITEEGKKEKYTKSQLKKDDESEEEEKSLNSDYDRHLSEFFENLNKNPKNPIESAWNRQKRFSRRDVEDKVSKTEVQNTILKNLPEDNYQSVYSPGIKRRLLSIENEAENDDGYTDAGELDKSTADEPQGNYAEKELNKFVDPMILKLFSTGGFDERKSRSRSRRSLTNPFHSNFKREIDLDESMPNDFQNFLVTSLGGVGSQKREVVKRDEALWEGKESSQDNYNQIVESSPAGKEANEDSALEKREVSASENRKGQSYAKSSYYASESANFAEGMSPFNRAEKKARSESKSKAKSKTSEFADEKLPTQIRIQITNGSGKEKKSSKPIMEESETTSTDMENLPKEKEFFDKNKINPLLSNELPKFRQASKSKFSYGEFEESENRDLGAKQKPHYPYRRKKRKRKKYVPENSAKPVNDFIAFDQKAMESLLRKYKINQNMMSDQTTQKIPVSHPLPQVETVYNPTQGTDKAQLQTIRFGKMSSISNKNEESSKNSLQSNDASSYDEGVIRSYPKSENMRSNKGELKEFEDVNWKPYSGRLGVGQEFGRDNQFGMLQLSHKTQNTFGHNTDNSHIFNSYTPNKSGQKSFSLPYNRYFYHPPSSVNPHSIYDTLKQKQEIKNQNTYQNILNKDYMDSKPYTKPFYFNEGNLLRQDEKDKMQNPMTPYPTTGEGSWNPLDRPVNKKPYPQKYKMKDYYPLATKSTGQAEHKSKNPYLMGKKYFHNLDYDKSLNMDSSQSFGTADTYKDPDYSDAFEYDYLDEDSSKELQLDEPIIKDALKKAHLNRFGEMPGYYHLLKTSEGDENSSSDEDDEFDEDYEENAEEDDSEDYSLLTNANALNPKLTKNNHDTEKFQDELNRDVSSQFGYYYPQVRGHDIDLTKFISNTDDKFDQGVVVTNFKRDPDLLRGSTSLLRKANENSNLFGKNVMKNLNRFDGTNYLEKLKSDRILGNWNSIDRNDLKKRKLYMESKFKRSHGRPQIGSRLFYAAKTEINDNRDLAPSVNVHQPKDGSNNKYSYYKLPAGNPFSAEFAGLGNNIDQESEQNEKHVNENLVINDESDKNSQKDDHSEDVESVKENSESDGGTTSRDDFLESNIGKYTMIKTIKPSNDLNRASVTKEEKHGTDDSEKHKIIKRSIGNQKYAEKEPKIIKKRLSSGHLTENNFRKYHKKNLNRKRHIKNSVFSPYELTAFTCQGQNIQMSNENQKKRSALDLFKKITNKDRDNKKVENSDGRTAGFEPLLSLTDKKYDNSLKDGKDSFVQDKKSTSGESSHEEIKGNLPELKAHAPNEGQHLKAQLNDKKGEKSKEALKEYQMSSAQGPWKIELNGKYDFKAAERPDKENRKSLKSVKIMETKPLKDESDNLKAFLVISKNVEALGRSPVESFLPFSRSFLREIGNNYRPKFDEDKGISKKNVRKRSLASSKTQMKISKEDAEKMSDEQTARELNAENHINSQEKNRALHDTENFSEGDPRPQAPHVLQRHAQKNGSSVNANEKCENSRFLSRERLMKSVFPPISDENIIRDSRHINEETSEYLGQQIVEAILSHVSANPKFKQLIAPGLNVRTAAYKEGTEYNKKRALHQVEFSDQFQAFFKKFMVDLERLAEKHVKKRMCHQIDKQSKLFLQSLLKSPRESAKEEKIVKNNEKICPSNEPHLEVESDQNPNSSFTDTPETVNLIQMKEKSLKHKQQVLDNLKMKQGILLKLIDDYQNLSNVEKGALDVNYLHLIQELDQTNQELGTSESQPSLISTSNFYGQSNFRNETNPNNDNKFGFQRSIKLKKKNFGNKYSNEQTSTDSTSCKLYLINQSRSSSPAPSQCSCSNCAVTQKPIIQSQTLPVFFFSEIENPKAQNDQQTTTPNYPFEKVHSINETENTQDQKKKNELNQKGTNEQSNPTDFKDEKLRNGVPTPQRFDLLSYENSTAPPDTAQSALASNQALKRQFLAEDKDEITKNLNENKSDNFNFEDYLSQRYGPPTELHKLSLGDAAGLQLSLKYRGPWVSNLEVAKTLRSIPPSLPEPKADIKENQPCQRNTDQFLGEEFRNPRSLVVPGDKYSLKSPFSPRDNWNDQSKYFYKKPIFTYSIDKKFFTPKVRPFENATQPKWPDKVIQTCPLQYLLRKSPPPPRKTSSSSNSVSQGKPSRERNPLREHFEKKIKRRIPHFLVHRPKGFAKKHRSSKI